MAIINHVVSSDTINFFMLLMLSFSLNNNTYKAIIITMCIRTNS